MGAGDQFSTDPQGTHALHAEHAEHMYSLPFICIIANIKSNICIGEQISWEIIGK